MKGLKVSSAWMVAWLGCLEGCTAFEQRDHALWVGPAWVSLGVAHLHWYIPPRITWPHHPISVLDMWRVLGGGQSATHVWLLPGATASATPCLLLRVVPMRGT